jgi:hypothetical protein
MKFEWGEDSLSKIAFNPSQKNVLAGVGLNRGVVLYDIRGKTPLY